MSKIFSLTNSAVQSILLLVLIGMAGTGVVRPTDSSAEAVAGPSAAEKQRIHITADQLDSDSQSRYAEFIGKVRVTQGRFVIDSDRLRIYYKEESDGVTETAEIGKDIDRIIAQGNVRIQSEDRTATSDQAEYAVDDMILVLTGENCKVIGGDNSISGKKIIFYRKDGRIKVESGGADRVEALFYSGKGPATPADRQQPIVISVAGQPPETAKWQGDRAAQDPAAGVKSGDHTPPAEVVASTQNQAIPPPEMVVENIVEDRPAVVAEDVLTARSSGDTGFRADQDVPAASTSASAALSASAPAASAPLLADEPSTAAAVSTVPPGSLQTIVGLSDFSNETTTRGTGLAAMLEQRIGEAVTRGCPKTVLFLPGGASSPPFLADVPRRPTGRIDNVALVAAGRKAGMRLVIAGSIVDLRFESETRGIFWMKDTYPLLRLVFHLEIFDCESGSKSLDERFSRRVEIDELDYEVMQTRSGMNIEPILPLLRETLAEMSAEITRKTTNIINQQHWRGFVTVVDGDRIQISPGARSGVAVGSRFSVFRQKTIEGAEGHLFYLRGRKIGEVQIVSTGTASAWSRPVAGRGMAVGDVLYPAGVHP